MYKLAAFTIVAFFAIGAFGHETDANKEYIECAHEKMGILFGNRTYIDGSLACLKDQQSAEANELRDMVKEIGARIEQFVTDYENEPECVEKYDKLYEDLADNLEYNEEIRKKMQALDGKVQECIEVELQRAYERIMKTYVCKDLKNHGNEG